MNEIAEQVKNAVSYITGYDPVTISEVAHEPKTVTRNVARHLYRYFVMQATNKSFGEVSNLLGMKRAQTLRESWEYVKYNKQVDPKLQRIVKQIEEMLGWADR